MINDATLQLIKRFEGTRLDVYLDPVKIATVGTGHVVRPGDNLKVGDVITKARADALLRADLHTAENDVDMIVPWAMTENERGALVSFTFNCGAGNLRKLITHGRPSLVPSRLLLFDHAGGKILAGLARRRQAERQLYLTPHAAQPQSASPPIGD